jgi:hypothetical protein
MSPGYGHNERDDCGHPCDFSSAATASGNAFDALTQSLVTFNEATADSAETIAELQERLSDLMKESKKGGLSERQIQKTMRFRGKR